PRVPRGNRERAADEGVFEPDAVLEDQRDQTERERQIETRIAAGNSRADRAEVAFEEQRVGIPVEMQLRLVVSGAERRAGEMAVAIERAEESVDAFGRGEFQIDVEVQSSGGDAGFGRAKIIVSHGISPVAADEELRDHEIFFAEKLRRGLERSLAIELAS